MIKSALQSSLTNDIKYRSMSAGNVPSSEYLIQTTIVGATPAASVEFDVSAYAGIYRHLKIICSIRNTSAAILQWNFLRFNDSTSSYRGHQLYGSGSTVGSGTFTETNLIVASLSFSNNSTSGAFGASEIEILDAFSSNKNKTTRSIAGSSQIVLTSGAWFNTSPISKITLGTLSGDFGQYSRFSLYGVTA